MTYGRSVKFFMWFVLMALSLALAACGGGGGGGSSGGGDGDTGGVIMGLTDAALDDLQSFTLEVTEVYFITTDGEEEQYYPFDGDPEGTTLTEDLVSLQGSSGVLGSSLLPVGTYNALRLVFDDVSAIDVDGNEQTIIVSSNDVTLSLATPFTVAEGSDNAVILDFDLNASLLPEGTADTYILIPAITAEETNEAVTLEKFAGLVTAIDTTTGSFDVEIVKPADDADGDATEAGTVTLLTSATTVFDDGEGTRTEGTAIDNLVLQDFVYITGSLTPNGTISADIVQRVPGTEAGGGIPDGGMSPLVEIAGTITDVDTGAGTVTINLEHIAGNTAEVELFSNLEVDITDDTALFRGGTAIVLADMAQGNFCIAFANESAGTFEAVHADMLPSYIAGDVTNVAAGAGEDGGDVVTFTPSVINQLKPDDIDGITATLNFETFGFDVNEGDYFEVCAYFVSAGGGDLSNTLQTFDFGAFSGVVDVGAASNAEAFVRGTVDSDVTAEDNAGDVEFNIVPEGLESLDISIPVTVADGEVIYHFMAGGAVETISATDAVAALNAAPAAVEVQGVPDDAGGIEAFALFIMDEEDFSANIADLFTFVGVVEEGSTVTLGADTLTFELDASQFGGSANAITVTISETAFIEVIDETGISTEVSLAAAETELEDGPEFIEVVGTAGASGGDFDANLRVTMWVFPDGFYPAPDSFFIGGTLAEGATVEADASGNIVFSIFDYFLGEDVTVTLTADAAVINFNEYGEIVELSLSQAQSLLEANPYWIELEGSEGPSDNAFTADRAMRTYSNPSVSEENTFGNVLAGLVSVDGDVSQDGDNNVTFDLEFFGPGCVPYVTTVTVSADATMELYDESGVSTLTSDDLENELNDPADLFVEVSGSVSYSGATTYDANLSARLFRGDGSGTFIPEFFFLGGTVAEDTTASENASGDVEVTLTAWDPMDTDGDYVSDFSVTISSSAEMTLYDVNGTITPLDSNTAVDALNAFPSWVDVSSSTPPEGLTFTADLALNIYAGFATGPSFSVLSGEVAEDSTAALNASGQIEFGLSTPGESGELTTINIFVSSDAHMEMVDAFGNFTALSLNATVDALNSLDAFVSVEGSNPPTADGFSADERLSIFVKPEVDDYIFGIASGTAAVNGSGDVEFDLDQDDGDGNITTFAMTVSATAFMQFFTNDGTVEQLDADGLVALLNSDDDGFIDAGGTLSGSAFTASYINVFEMWEQGGFTGSGAYLSGSVVADSAALNGTDIDFTMDYYDWFTGDTETLDVTVTDEAHYFLVDENGVNNVSAADAVEALNDNPFGVDVTGSADFVGGSGVYEADGELWIYADTGQFGTSFYHGHLATGSTAVVNANGDVDFDLEVEGEFGTTFTIAVTIDMASAELYVEFIDEFFVSEELTDANVIAAKINNDAASIDVASFGSQSGETFIADSYVGLFEVDLGGGDFGILTGVMTQGTTASATSGDLAFSMAVDDGAGGTTTVSVTVSPNAYFELFDYNGASTVTPSDMATALNDNPDTHYLFVQGSLAYNGETTYYADTYVSLSIFGQSNFLYGQPSSAATVDGNGDVLFDLDIVNEIGEPETVAVTIDVSLAYVEFFDEFGGQMLLTVAQDIADTINDDAADVSLESSTVQSGGVFLADVYVGLYAVAGSGGGGGFIQGNMTPGSTASATGGDLTFSLDTFNPETGLMMTVAVTVSAGATFDFYDYTGAYASLTAADMATELNNNGGTGFDQIYVIGSLPWNGETSYYAEQNMNLTLYTGGGGAFFYKGVVNTSTNAPMHDGQNIIFDMDVYDGSEGAINPVQTITVSVAATPNSDPQDDATIDQYDGAFFPALTDTQGDIDAIVNALAADPFEVEFEGFVQLAPTDTTYTVDSSGFLTVYLVPVAGGGYLLSGTGATASYNGGVPEVTFTLTLADASTLNVTVTDSAFLEYDDGLGGGIQNFASLDDVDDYINSNPSSLIYVEGTQPDNGVDFVADIRISIYPAPVGDGAMGTITGTAVVTGDIVTFSLTITQQLWGNAPPVDTVVAVSIDTSLGTTFYLPFGGSEIGPLSAVDAANYLNGNPGPFQIQIEGTYDDVGQTFEADAVDIFE